MKISLSVLLAGITLGLFLLLAMLVIIDFVSSAEEINSDSMGEE